MYRGGGGWRSSGYCLVTWELATSREDASAAKWMRWAAAGAPAPPFSAALLLLLLPAASAAARAAARDAA